MKNDWKNLIGKRCLVTQSRRYTNQLLEVKVLEVSPSGDSVKFQFPGGQFWRGASEYHLVEVLDTDKKEMDIFKYLATQGLCK